MDTQKDRIVALLQDSYGARPEHLWAKYPSYAVFRHPMGGKWFALLMELPRNKVGLAGDAPVWVLDVKVGPILSASLVSETGFAPARYMSKATWVSVLLDGTLPDERVDFLIGLSYDAAAPKASRKGTRGEVNV